MTVGKSKSPPEMGGFVRVSLGLVSFFIPYYLPFFLEGFLLLK